MDVIKRWIDESDAFLLILGGRYGSLEPTSGKSYVQLEYESAVLLGKPTFAVVIDEGHLEERVKQEGSSVLERENPQLLEQFKLTLQLAWSNSGVIRATSSSQFMKRLRSSAVAASSLDGFPAVKASTRRHWPKKLRDLQGRMRPFEIS
jgi:Domain of unknown function (DUF4062)